MSAKREHDTLFRDVPGHKRSTPVEVPKSIVPPMLAPRATKASLLRTAGDGRERKVNVSAAFRQATSGTSKTGMETPHRFTTAEEQGDIPPKARSSSTASKRHLLMASKPNSLATPAIVSVISAHIAPF